MQGVLTLCIKEEMGNMTLEGCGMVFFYCFYLLQTDTASVLLEAIGYIRFLQSQIEVMFLPFPLQKTMS